MPKLRVSSASLPSDARIPPFKVPLRLWNKPRPLRLTAAMAKGQTENSCIPCSIFNVTHMAC